MGNKLNKIQIERIESVLKDEKRELLKKFEKEAFKEFTYKSLMDAVKSGAIKPRKVLRADIEDSKIHSSYYGSVNVDFGEIFDISDINRELAKARKSYESYQKMLSVRINNIMNSIVLDGETLDWALKQLHK